MAEGVHMMPSQEDLRDAVVKFLSAQKGRSATATELAEAMAKKFQLTKSDLGQRQAHQQRSGGESAWRLQLRRVKYDLVKVGKVVGGKAQRGRWELAS
jgi:hypothetical protein